MNGFGQFGRFPLDLKERPSISRGRFSGEEESVYNNKHREECTAGNCYRLVSNKVGFIIGKARFDESDYAAPLRAASQ